MTLPDERYRAVRHARTFLYALLDSAKTPRVPTQIRREAGHCLRHYPGEVDMERAANLCPRIFKIAP